jgi:hypothetical protein
MDLPHPGMHGPGVITTRQSITPAGTVTTFRGGVRGIGYADSSHELEVLTEYALYSVDLAGNRIASEHALTGSPGMQALARSTTSGHTLFVTIDSKRGVELNEASGKTVRTPASRLGLENSGAVAAATTPSGRHIAASPATMHGRWISIPTSSLPASTPASRPYNRP